MVRKWLGFTIFDIIFPTFLDRRKMLYYNLYNKVEVYGFLPNASEKSSPTLKKRHQRNFLRVLQPHFSKKCLRQRRAGQEGRHCNTKLSKKQKKGKQRLSFRKSCNFAKISECKKAKEAARARSARKNAAICASLGQGCSAWKSRKVGNK